MTHTVISRRAYAHELANITENFTKIENCQSLVEYEAFIKRATKSYTGRLSDKELKGLVFGEPFLNFYLKEFGVNHNLKFERISDEDEDFQGVDCFGHSNAVKFAINHKFYSSYSCVRQEDTSGLAWFIVENSDYKPVVVTTSFDVSMVLANRISAKGGFIITRTQIDRNTNVGYGNVTNLKFWKDFAEHLRLDISHYDKLRKDALTAADKRASMKLDDWQKKDVETLAKHDRGIFIAPPGSGKTTIEAKLTEKWMTDPHCGPVIVISRVKALISQVMEEIVLINKYHPDRIAAYSDASHYMDLSEPLAVGTATDKSVHAIIKDAYVNKKPVIIGCVCNAGSVSLLKMLQEPWAKNIKLKIIVDELAEAIPTTEVEFEKLSENDSESSTIKELYNLNSLGRIDKLFGFDAVWKVGTHRGMDDATLWGQTHPLVEHTQYEMTWVNNVLVPVDLINVVIDDDMLKEVESFSNDPDLQIEIAGAVAAMRYELTLMNDTQNIAKAVAFSTGTFEARNTQDAMDKLLGKQLDVNQVVLGSTPHSMRLKIQSAMSDPNKKTGIVSNCLVWTKGIDVRELTASILGYGRSPSAEMLTHMIGRVTRRATGERGLVLENNESTFKKPRGRLYVAYLLNKEGGEKYSHIVDVYSKLYANGITIANQKFVGTKKSSKQSKFNNVPEDQMANTFDLVFEEVKDEIVDKIKIEEAIKQSKEALDKMREIAANKKADREAINSLFGWDK